MKTKSFIWLMTLVVALALVGCKGNDGNIPDDPQNPEETAEAKLISLKGMYYEIEMRDGSRLYFRKMKDFTDTPYYFSLISAVTFYSGHSQEKEMVEKYAYSGILKIPSSVKVNMGNGKNETYSVEGVEGGACRGMYKISAVVFPNSIRTIGEMAFAMCDGIESVEIPNQITELHSTFYKCKSLKEIKLPESLTFFAGLVDECPSIKEIILPSKLTLFQIRGCASFKPSNFPDSISVIHIEGCSAMNQINLPNGLKSIWLYNDSALTTLSIPKNVEYVQLYGCAGLNEVKCYAVNPPNYGGLMDYQKFILYVPKESISKYQADEDGWAFHASQILPLEGSTPDHPSSDCSNI